MVFYGHELTRLGVFPDQRKVEANVNTPPPSNQKGVLRLLGMATFWLNFDPSSVTTPIRALLMRDNEFCWREEVDGIAFDNLLALLTNAPVI